MKQMAPAQVTAKGNSARQLDGVNVTMHNGTKNVYIIAEMALLFFVQLHGQRLLRTQKNCTWATQT